MTYTHTLVILLLFICSSACTHDVFIRSNPAGAQIYVDDTLIGKSPAIYEEKIGKKETVEIRAEKEGYKTQKMLLAKSHWATPQLLATLGGCVCGGLCCGSTLGNMSDEIGPLGILGGLPVLSALYFTRQSDSNVYLKLKPGGPEPQLKKAPPSKDTVSIDERSDMPDDASDMPAKTNKPRLRALPSGYTY
jgi:hypothetical protein